MIAEGERVALYAFAEMVQAEREGVIRGDALAGTMGEARGEFADFEVKG